MTDRTRSAPQANPVGEEETSSNGGRAANRGGRRRRGSTSGSGGEAASAATAPRRRAEKNREPEYEEGSPGESLERMGRALIAHARKAAVRNLWAVVNFLFIAVFCLGICRSYEAIPKQPQAVRVSRAICSTASRCTLVLSLSFVVMCKYVSHSTLPEV